MSHGHNKTISSSSAKTQLGATPLLHWLDVALRLLFSRSSLALFDQAVVSGTRFLTTIIVGRLCGPDALGLYALAFSAIIFSGCLQESLLTSPYTIFIQHFSKRRRQRYAGSTFLQFGLLAAFCCTVLLLISIPTAFALGPDVVPILAVLLLVLPLSLGWEYARRTAFAHLNMPAALGFDITVSSIQLGCLGVLAYTGNLTTTTALLAIACGTGTVVAIWALLNVNRLRIASKRRVAVDLRRNWNLGKWLAGSQIMGAMTGHVGTWILIAAVGATEAGIFTAALTVVLLINPFILAAANIFGPRAAQVYASKGIDGLWQLVLKAIGVMTIVTALFTVGVGLFREALLVTFFGDDYVGQGTVVFVLALCTTFWIVSTLLAPALATIRKPAYSFVGTVLGFLITLVLGIPWIIYSGVFGAAGTMLVASAVDGIIRFLLFWQCVHKESLLSRESS